MAQATNTETVKAPEAEKTAKTETVKTTPARGRQLQATVSQDVYDAYEEYHWEARKNTVDIVRDALIAFGVSNNFLTLNAEGETVPTEEYAARIEATKARK